MTPRLRVGWCPGALRPMAAGDGLILRIKPRGATLSLDQADTIAALASRYGNGALDLTGRANLQIRGVREETLDPLIAGLRGTDLLDETPEAEAVRNVVSSPLAGLDPETACDIRPIVTALETRLAEDAELHRLPAKWSVVIEDGGRFPLDDVPADLRVEAAAGGGFNIALAGDPGRAWCPAHSAEDVAVQLMGQALTPQPMRMAEAVGTRGAAALFAAVGLASVSAATKTRHAACPIGMHALPNQLVLGVGAPFGRLAADAFARLTRAARPAGVADIRLTPWRALLMRGLDAATAATVREKARALGLIVDPQDPRLAVAACTGAPACHRATTPVRQHAAVLAENLRMPQAGIAIHVSGCEKGCAHPAPAPWTLVGRDGLYDLVRDGRPGDQPIACGLSFQDAASWLSRNGNPGRP